MTVQKMRAILWGEALGAVVVALTIALLSNAPPASSPIVVSREEVPPLPAVLSPDCLAALCIFAEARGEPFEGMVAVGSVLRNRMARRYQSDGTVPGTVFRPWAFSWANTNDRQRVRVFGCMDDDPHYQKALEAWRASETERPVGSAVLYHADYITPGWASAATVRFVKQIGRHRFFDEDKG